jgi:chaperonin cofactor prefoldin
METYACMYTYNKVTTQNIRTLTSQEVGGVLIKLGSNKLRDDLNGRVLFMDVRSTTLHCKQFRKNYEQNLNTFQNAL